MTDNIQNGEGVELLPCPFCGSQQITTAPDMRIGRPWWAVVCKACGISNTRENEAEAITAWNTRQSLTAREPATADVERIEAVFAENINEQALRLNIIPVATESPGWWQQRVRKAAVLDSLSRAAPSSEPATADVERVRIAAIIREATDFDHPDQGHYLRAADRVLSALSRAAQSSEPAIAEGER